MKRRIPQISNRKYPVSIFRYPFYPSPSRTWRYLKERPQLSSNTKHTFFHRKSLYETRLCQFWVFWNVIPEYNTNLRVIFSDPPPLRPDPSSNHLPSSYLRPDFAGSETRVE